MKIPNERGAKAWGAILARYDRGVKHLDDFYAAFDAFRRENPLQIDRKTDPQTRDVTYYLAHVPETPPELPLIAGDALHNFRSTLDHLAWKLVEAAGKLPTVKTGFPIFDSEADYRSRSPKKVEGMRAITKERIDNLRPYKGGYNDLWILHRLDIIDKHRLLLTLGTGRFAKRMPSKERAKVVADWESRYGSPAPSPLAHGMLIKNITEGLLTIGDELKTVPAAEAEDPLVVQHDYFDITINEPGVSEGESCYLLFERIKGEVERIINDFAPML
jgi:hypothetical protein